MSIAVRFTKKNKKKKNFKLFAQGKEKYKQNNNIETYFQTLQQKVFANFDSVWTWTLTD